jgi:hypothetical protein
MQTIFAIGMAALPFIIYFLFNKSLVKYFNKVCHETGENPITAFQQIVGLLFFSPIIIGFFDDDLFLNPLICICVPAMFTIILLYSNFKFKNPIRVIALTVAQIVFGFMFICRLFVWIFAMTWSILMSILYGNGPSVTYNPFVKTSVDANGNVVQYKSKFFFVPDYYSEGVLTNLNKYTDEMNASRIAYERNRLERELEEVENKKQYALIYGYDISGYEDRISKIKSDIDNLK